MLRQKLNAHRTPWEFRQFFAALMIVLLVLPSSAAWQAVASPAPQAGSTASAAPGSPAGSAGVDGAGQPQPRVSKTVSQSPILDAAVSRNVPTLNGGAIDGSLRVFEGKNYSIGSGFSLTGDLFTVGTPEIDLQAGASHGGVVDDGGAATPAYKLRLEKDVKLPGKIHIKADPLPLPSDIPVSVPAPSGTRKIKINQASDVSSIGDWGTVRELTVNAPDVTIDVPPGDYDTIILNGPCLIRFGSGDYNFASGLSLHQSSTVEVSGPASVTLGTSFQANGGKILAATGTNPHQIRLNILGSTVNLAGDAQVQALVRAVNTHVSLGGTSLIRGQVLADRLTLTGGKIIGDVRPGDTTPPVIQVLSPGENSTTYNFSTTVQGTAKDEGEPASGVAGVTVNDLPATFDPATGNWMVKVPLSVGSNLLTILATDRADVPNTGRAQVQIERRNPPPPVLSVTYPVDGAFLPNNVITVAGRAVSEAAEVSVSVTINGQPATVAGGEFTGTLALVDGVNSISIQASDSLGQASQLELRVTCDSTAPQVSFKAVPGIVLPGATYRLSAEASDNQRLASVEFTVDGQRQALLTAPPYEFDYLVPASEPGRRLTAAVLARDASGRMGTDTAQMRVAGPAGIAGRVFDDSTGYTMPGVAVRSTDGATAETTADGAYFAVSPSSHGVARFAKPGYTAVEREFALDSGRGAWLPDARLTPIDPRPNPVGPEGGTASGDSGRIRLAIPAGLLAAPVDLRLTSISPQGLIALLPFGWSPVPGGVVDVRLSGPSAPVPDLSGGTATLTVSELPDPVSGLTPCLAFYDESDNRWEVLEAEVQPSADGSLSGRVTLGAQYAFLLPDSGSTAPSPAVAGQPLPAVPPALASALNAATALATATPRSALYSASAQSTIRVVATPGVKLPSGTFCEAAFDERYDLRAQSEPRFVERAAQTLVLYSYPVATAQEPNLLSASFVAKPTIVDIPLADFGAANLHVRIRSAEPDSGSLTGTEGGAVTAPGGWELAIPSGALSTPTPVFLRPVDREEISLELPEDYEIAAAALVDLSGQTLATGARLSVPAMWGDTPRLAVARVVSAGDRRAPKLVARAVEVNGLIVSTTEPPAVPNGLALPGIKEGGLYVFIRLPGAFGYIFGRVARSGGAVAPGVRVSTDTGPFVDVTLSDGTYVLPGAAGTGPDGMNNLAAASLASDETGNGSATLPAQDSLAQVHIPIASVPLQVASVSPVSGASDVPVSGSVRVSFTKPVTPASLTGSSFRLTTMTGSPVSATVTVLPGNQAATLIPSSSLAPGTSYRVGLTTAVQDLYGHPLVTPFQSSFSTAPIQPMSTRLTPDRITISYPDTQGFVTITIPAGLIPAGSVVVALNTTLGSSTTVTVGFGPLAIRLLASPGDDIRIMVREPSGASYEVAQAAYRSPDGFSTVGANGGTVTSADGRIVLVIEPGAIAGLAEIRLIELPESTIPIPREPGSQMDPTNVRFAAGIRVESRGTFTVQKQPHLEVLAPAGAVEGQRGACLKPVRAIDPDSGQEVDVWETVTSTRVENGRMKTTSPPFGGLDLTGMTLYMFLPVMMRVIYGSTTEGSAGVPVSDGGGCLQVPPGDKGVPDVLCMVQQHGVGFLQHQVTARTNKDGSYAIFDMRFDDPNSAGVLFIDETNRRRTVGFGCPPTTMEMQFLYGLSGFVTLRANGVFAPGTTGGDGSRPVIHMYGEQVGLAEGEADPLRERGVVRVGKKAKVYAVVDRSVARIDWSVAVGNAEPTPVVSMPEPNGFSVLIDVEAEGGWLVTAKACGTANSASTCAEAEYRFVALRDPNTRPPLEGAPFVLSVFPERGAADVDVATEIRVEFSEPVTNLRAVQTIVLKSDTDTNGLDGLVLSGGMPVSDAIPVSSIIFKPGRALRGGVGYTLSLTADIKDTNNQPLRAYSSSFKTFAGMTLTQNPAGEPGSKVVLDGPYAFTVEGYKPGADPNLYESSMLRTYDVSDPRKPTELGAGFQIPQRATDLAVSSKTRYTLPEGAVNRVGVVTSYFYWVAERPANVWILNLDNPQNPTIIGVVSLYLPIDMATAPFCVKIHEGRVYIGNAPYRGVIVVDIQKAIELFRDASKRTDRVRPEWQAVAQYSGFGMEAIVQSTPYNDNPTVSRMATALDVISQNVPDHGDALMHGPMPVAYASNTGASELVVLGFSPLNDGYLGYWPGDGEDRRILSRIKLPGHPLAARVLSQIIVDGHPRDVAVVLGSIDEDQLLWIYDVSNPANPSLMGQGIKLGDLQIAGRAGRAFDVEGALAYLTVGSEIAVIDFSRTDAVSLVTLLPASANTPSSMAVHKGFIHTLSLREGLSVRIARPVSQVFVHGKVDGDSSFCANPVILRRDDPNHGMVGQGAEIYFQLYGRGSSNSAEVNIDRNGFPFLQIPAEILSSDDAEILTGRAIWKADQVDLTAQYTVRVRTGAHESEPEPVPTSFLISDYQTTIQALSEEHMLGDLETPPYCYVLGASAQVTLTIDDGERLSALRSFGLNSERLELERLPIGRHSLRLKASIAGYEEVVTGVLDVARNPNNVRVPGHTVVGGVDLAIGQLGLTYTDASIKGRGLSLEFTRSYNQGTANVFSPLGYGWRHNYQMLLVHNRELRTYTIIGGDAQGQTFEEKDGELKSLPPFHTTLVKNDDGSFDYFDKAHVKYHFPGALERDSYSYYQQAYVGNLDYIEEPNLNRIEMFYDGEGRLYSAQEKAGGHLGRALNFEYEEALAPFVGVIVPNLAGSTAASCITADRFPMIRDAFVKSKVGRAWRIKQLKGPGGLDIRYEYDLDGNLIRATRKGGGEQAGSDPTPDYVWQYKYRPPAVPTTAGDVSHLLYEITNPNESATRYEFKQDNPAFPIVRAQYPEGVSNSYDYQMSGVEVDSVQVTDGRLKTTNYVLDHGLVVRIEAPRGASKSFEYNAQGLKSVEVDPMGLRQSFIYDDRGNLIRLEQTGGTARITTLATFDPMFSKPTSRTDANGNTTSYQLDARGNVTQVTRPDSSVITHTYAGNGDLIGTVDELGLRTTIAYDNHGNPVSVTQETSSGQTVQTDSSYDIRSRQVSTSSTLGPSFVNRYDALDRLVFRQVSDPAGIREGETIRYAYRTGGQLTLEEHTAVGTSGQSLKKEVEYDGLDRQVGVRETASDLEGSVASGRTLVYDANSNLIQETNRRGIVSRYRYDDLNFLIEYEVAGGVGSGSAEAVIAPDLVGNPSSVINRHGDATTLKYDGLHRLVGRELGGYGEEWTLDGNGNILSMTDRNGHTTSYEYDPLDRVESSTDPLGRQTTWNYRNGAGRRVSSVDQPWKGLKAETESDGLGRPLIERIQSGSDTYATTWAYNGLTVDIRDPRGTPIQKQMSGFGDVGQVTIGNSTTTWKYAALGALLSRRDALGFEWTYKSDGLNRVRLIQYPETVAGSGTTIAESFSYDEEGNLLRHTNRRGIVTSQTYDHLGRLLTRTTGGIPVENVAYEDPVRRVTRTDGNGRPTIFQYDALGRLEEVTNAENRKRSFHWDGVNLRGETDFRGPKTEYEYDPVNRLIQVTDREKKATIISWEDKGGTIRTVTDRRSNQSREVYDGLGRLTTVERGRVGDLGPVASYRYDGNDNLVWQQDGEGGWSVHTYTPENRPETSDHAGLELERYTWDAVGNLRWYEDGRGGRVEQVPDALGRVRERADGLGNRTLFEYDGEGLLTRKTTPKGHATTYTYNALGSLEEVRDARSGVWRYGYDNVQNLTSVTDPLGRTTRYTPDVLGRVEKLTPPLGPARSFGYDENGNLSWSVDAKGQRSAFTYDNEDRLTAKTITGPEGTLAWSYSRDPEGNPWSITQSGAGTSRSWTRAYDERNRLTDIIDSSGRTVGSKWDQADRLASFTDAFGRTTTYVYDLAGRLSSAGLPGGATVGMGWTRDGLLESVAYPGGVERRYGYDEADRVTSIVNRAGAAASEEFHYSYDANSNRTGETRKQNGQTTRTLAYDYDELDRLTRADYGGTAVVGYGYDAVGNRKTESGQGPDGQAVDRSYDYNALNQLVSVTDALDPTRSIAFEYDPNGNLAVERAGTRTRSFTHDLADRLVSAAESTGGPAVELGSYAYDFQGRRIGRTTATGRTEYVYRGDGIQVANELDGFGNRLAAYDFATDLARADFAGEGERWYFHDALGSTTSLVSLAPSSTGPPTPSVGARYEYDAWGRLISAPQPATNRVLYTGYRRDEETDLDYALARYYDPRFGRFLQQDPLPDVVEQARVRAVAVFTYEALAAAPAGWTSPEFGGREDALESLALGGAVHNKLKALQWAREEIQPAEWTGSRPDNVARRSERKEHRGDALTESSLAVSDSPELPESLNAGLSVPGLGPSDPAAWNRYIYGSNNPLRFIDPRGEDVWDCVKRAAKAAVDTVVETVEGTVATAKGMVKDPVGTTKEVVKGTVEAVKVAGRAYFTEEGRKEFGQQWSALTTEDKVEAISRGVTAGIIAVVGSKAMPKVTRAVTSKFEAAVGTLPRAELSTPLLKSRALSPKVASNDLLSIPNRLEKKLGAWRRYEGDLDLSAWSKRYDQLQTNRLRGRWAESFGEPGASYPTPYGRRFTDNAPGLEIKTGYQSATKFVRTQIIKDSFLKRTVPGYDPVWRFVDEIPSRPLLDKLDTFGIRYELPRR